MWVHATLDIAGGVSPFLESDSLEGIALRDELWSLRNRNKRIEIQGKVYKAQVTTFESFGETAFRAKIVEKKTPSPPSRLRRMPRS